MLVTDEQIGRNVLRLRGDRSQKDVADAMRARGWSWSQTTVWKVEQGTRSLRLAEAEDLREVLGADEISLVEDDDTTALRAQLLAVNAAWNDIHRAVDDMLHEQEQLGIVVGDDTSRAFWGGVDWLAVAPEDVVLQVRRNRGEDSLLFADGSHIGAVAHLGTAEGAASEGFVFHVVSDEEAHRGEHHTTTER